MLLFNSFSQSAMRKYGKPSNQPNPNHLLTNTRRSPSWTNQPKQSFTNLQIDKEREKRIRLAKAHTNTVIN